ncbi:hypothetical protein PR048_009503 [Dryococelus australis]|uniref:DUF4371 domain-containing protein n=1 Tax=Dryococelus australis TaxID=614101 RepID=A0ABQ9I057_9NEOP|nr:hypothetical protein PR048_009503 [Dryococelus australis]
MNSTFKMKMLDNRQRLIPAVETIYMCARQEMLFRGTNYSGLIDVDGTESDWNDGNFRTLLRMPAKCGDETLKRHMESAVVNALYASPVIQNEIIYVCRSLIQEKIVNQVNGPQNFFILAEETCVISGPEQMSLYLRYVEKYYEVNNYILREDFLDIVPVYDLIARCLAQVITNKLESHELNMPYMCGQDYDGTSSRSGYLRGVQAIICQKFRQVKYVHCIARNLNLALSHACSVQPIRNCISTVPSVINFINGSSQRINILKFLVSLVPKELFLLTLPIRTTLQQVDCDL